MTDAPIAPLVDLLKVLAHPVRLRILALLREGELCVCQIVEVLGGATSTASEHLTALRKAGLLTERKEGRWVRYALAPRPELGALLEALWPHVDVIAQVASDRRTAKRTRNIPVEVICVKARACAGRDGKEHGRGR